jgi:hypothetical protein
MAAPAVHKVTIVALDGVVPFDLAGPCDVFGRIVLPVNDHSVR